MSVIITGGLGHVGSWVARLLADQGREVILCDTAPGGIDQPHLDYLAPVRDAITYERIDILDDHGLFEVFNRHREHVEGVIHCVSVIAGPTFQLAPYRNISVNAMGTLKIYELCRILNIPRVVNLSSGAVYGDAAGPQTEAGTPYKATDLYGATKIAAEVLGDQYSATYDMDIRQARLFFIYGPGKRPSHMHATYQALFGPLEGLRDVAAPSGLDQSVDWTHVADAAAGIVALFEAEKLTQRAYNLSCGTAFSSREIVDGVTDLLGHESGMSLGAGPFVHRGAPLDIHAAREQLGFSPRYTRLADGLASYRDWLAGLPAALR